MSEFYPTTTVSFITTYVPFDDYDYEEDSFDEEEVVATGIPMSILTATHNQFVPSEGRETTIKTYTARMRGHIHVELDYRIEDERTGERYMIDSMDKTHNPVGDPSWFLRIRKVPRLRGQ